VSDANEALTPNQRKTEPARREKRYRTAQKRIRQIAEGRPKLTAEQLQDLAALLAPGTREAC
jgi:hypothetical protein